MRWTRACQRPPRPVRGRRILLVTPHSSISTSACGYVRGGGNPSAPVTRSSRHGSEIARTVAGHGRRRALLSPCARMTSRRRRGARSPQMASTTRPTTRAGCVWVLITTPPMLPRTPAAGGGRSAAQVYPEAQDRLVTADAGGSHRRRARWWNVAVQELADRRHRRLSVCHVPPGTSKWHKIEHRMFCQITNHWRGRPCISRSVIVNCMGNTQTTTGLPIKAALDRHLDDIGLKVTDEQPAALRSQRDTLHGAWNDTLSPRA